MFFKHNEIESWLESLPNELVNLVIRKLPVKDQLQLMLVSKYFLEHAKDPSVWKTYGAKSYEDFVTRIKILPQKFQIMILNQQYTLPVAENIVEYLSLSRIERQEKFFVAKQLAAMPTPHYIDAMLSDNGVIALAEKLITPEQAADMRVNILKETIDHLTQSGPSQKLSF